MLNVARQRGYIADTAPDDAGVGGLACVGTLKRDIDGFFPAAVGSRFRSWRRLDGDAASAGMRHNWSG